MEVQDFAGGVVVTRTMEGGQRRWWFDRTDGGRMVFAAEILDYDEDISPLVDEPGRVYVSEKEMEVTDEVVEALDDEGFITPPVDTDGRELA